MWYRAKEVALPRVELDCLDGREDLVDKGKTLATQNGGEVGKLLNVITGKERIGNREEQDDAKGAQSSDVTDDEVEENHHR